jgi:hypothetical protein
MMTVEPYMPSAGLLAACACCFASLCAGQIISFDRENPGAIPEDWTVAMTHEGGSPKWEVLADPSAPSAPNVIAQTSTDATNARFPLAIYGRQTFTNGAVEIRFKPVAGTKDQAAGIIWRYRDPNNYYLVRANALEDNVVLYKVENGRRTALEPKGAPSGTYGVKQSVPSGTWGSLRVTFTGADFAVIYNGAKVMEVRDETFAGPGRVGLWTKADSVTYFDDVQIEVSRE